MADKDKAEKELRQELDARARRRERAREDDPAANRESDAMGTWCAYTWAKGEMIGRRGK